MNTSTNIPNIDYSSGILRLTGRSLIIDSDAFYNPLIEKVKEYISTSNPLKEIEIILDYINSSTVRSLLKMFLQLESLKKTGKNVHIKWFYEANDEIMYEHGKTLEALVEIPMELVKFYAS